MLDKDDKLFGTIEKQIEYWNKTGFGLVGPRNEKEMSRYIRELVVDITNLRILDHGCGIGRLYRGLGCPDNYVGIDVSTKYLKEFRKRNKKPVLILTKSFDMPFLDNEFDLILSYSVFTHFTKSQYGYALKELNRVLKPDGIMLISIFDENISPQRGNWRLIPREKFISICDSLRLQIKNEVNVKNCTSYEVFFRIEKK